MTISQEAIDQALEKCKNQEDIFGENGLVKDFIKRLLQTALDAEMEQHLGYQKHEKPSPSSNSRNGYSQKQVKGD
ncbi:transposase, partial [Piscirickettsia litoralis]|uniref:transposase n=1 Tax=Piscirickettsia litoralis TaxID=1891921 RepID=UPI0019143847